MFTTRWISDSTLLYISLFTEPSVPNDYLAYYAAPSEHMTPAKKNAKMGYRCKS